MWFLLAAGVLEAVALSALVHWWRRPVESFLGGAAGRRRWMRRLLIGVATGWLGVGLVPVVAYVVLSARVRPGDEPIVENAREEAVVGAAPDTCLAVVSDFARYPEWAETASVQILEHDAGGRAASVRMARTSPTGQSFFLTMAYDYATAPLGMRSRVVGVEPPDGADGDMAEAMAQMSASMRGAYRFEPDGDGTRIIYDLTVALPPGLPSFLAGRMASAMAGRTVELLRARVEALSAPREEQAAPSPPR